MIFLLFAVLRFFQIQGGVAVNELQIDSLFPAAIAGLAPDAVSAVVDVTNHPEYVVGCTYSRAVSNGTRSVAAGGDTCVSPAPPKFIAGTVIALQLTAAEWTLAQAKISAGDGTTARALGQLLSTTTMTVSSVAVSSLVTQGVITPARATVINTALTSAAQ